MNQEPLLHPHFICQSCGKRNVIEVDTTEGFPQTFVWDCGRCCRPHEITVCDRARESLEIMAKSI
ncbi:MAG: CPXCG motif-containing cysteine-rich protein [Mariprofundaceae bacterium]|nr:CPXCG motif-containing cysteine-rich protein [Mariprofundaceae bacterium]